MGPGANFWKSFVHACLSLFGRKPGAHRLLADHLTAEYRVRTEGRGRTVDEWKVRPEQFDNHWLDCLVGCAVAASTQGVHLSETGVHLAQRREPIKLSSLPRAR